MDPMYWFSCSENCSYPECMPFPFVCQDDSEVRLSDSLSEGEIKATQKRREKVLMCLKNLGIHCDKVSTDSPIKERRITVQWCEWHTECHLRWGPVPRKHHLSSQVFQCRLSVHCWEKDSGWEFPRREKGAGHRIFSGIPSCNSHIYQLIN